VGRFGEPDRRILGRALLVHPRAAYREVARAFLAPRDFWPLVVHPSTPAAVLREAWDHLRPRVDASYLKIFFVTARDRLVERGDAGRVLETVAFLKEFYTVNAFHEDPYFDLLLGLDAPVRAEARRHGLLVDFDAEYVRRYRAFLQGSRLPEQAPEGWGQVPLPVQRRLARRGHFLAHFTCHPIDAIALECLRYITARENVTEFVRQPRINAALLRELARHKPLFRRDDARFALVANPKTPGNIVLQHIHHLSRLELADLARSRECNQVARSHAQKLLGRAG
jgi:hypothetical protein